MKPPVACLSFSKTDTSSLLLIVLIGLAARLGCIAIVPSPLESDYLHYWNIATNIYAGRGIVVSEGIHTAFLSTGYPIFLSIVFFLFGPSLAVVKGANVFLGIASIVLVHLTARRLFQSSLVATTASLLFAIYVESIVYTAYVAKENLAIFLILTQFYISSALGDANRFNLTAIALGIVTGCLAVVGTAYMAFLPGILMICLRSITFRLLILHHLPISMFSAALVIFPLARYNHQTLGVYAINTNAGFNLYIGNNENSTAYFQDIKETPLGPTWHNTIVNMGEVGTDRLLRQLALSHIAENPTVTLKLMARKAVAFWWPPSHDGAGPASRTESIARAIWLIQYLVLIGFFALSVLELRRMPHAVGALWILAALYTALHMIFYVIYRYRLPFMPIACIGASVGFWATVTRTAKLYWVRPLGP